MAPVKFVVAACALLGSAAAPADPVDRWAPEIALASERFDIPRAWIRQVMRIESSGRLQTEGMPIVSRAGAMGLMQLMPATWREMRATLGLGPDPFDPSDNILAGAAYLKSMYDRFGYPGLFAAYNAGPRRYSAFLAGARQLPAETRAYVAEVASSASENSLNPPAGSALFAVGSAPPSIARRPQSPEKLGLFVRLDGRESVESAARGEGSEEGKLQER